MKLLTVLILLSAVSALRAEPLRVACVGDSITEGTVLKKRSTDSYPSVLGRLLGPEFEVQNFGCSGATVTSEGEGAKPYMGQPVFEQARAFAPDLVVLMLGTNDTKTAVFGAGAPTFRDRYQELLEAFRALPSPPRILICLPVPVMGEGRFTINEPNRQKLIPLVAQLARDNQAELIDLDPVFLGKPELFTDLVHPTEAGTAAIAAAVAEKILEKSPHGH